MWYKKFFSFFLFALSFIVVGIGGYQCATKVDTPGRGSIPIVSSQADRDIGPTNTINLGTPYDSLPQESTDRCARSQFRDLGERYGAMGGFKLDHSSLVDYRLGREANFDINCSRMYLSMNKIRSERVFKGQLTIAYQEGGNIKIQRFTSGYSANDNKYNKWTRGRWTANSQGKIRDKEFYAIFEDEHSAIILELEDVRENNTQGDGVQTYIGAGNIYYKMFRIWDGDRNDVCYFNGTYVSKASNRPAKRSRCWLIGTGPYSCRPEGVLGPRDRVTDIDLAGDLECYTRLGRFYSLDIEEAFNVDDISDLGRR